MIGFTFSRINLKIFFGDVTLRGALSLALDRRLNISLARVFKYYRPTQDLSVHQMPITSHRHLFFNSEKHSRQNVSIS